MKKLTRDCRSGDDARLGGARNRMELRAMSNPDKCRKSTVAIVAFACAVFVVAMAIAHGAAVLQQRLNPQTDPFHYLVIFTIWACISLLGPALCFHVFSRSNSPNGYWRAFWTFAYLALLVHLYW